MRTNLVERFDLDEQIYFALCSMLRQYQCLFGSSVLHILYAKVWPFGNQSSRYRYACHQTKQTILDGQFTAIQSRLQILRPLTTRRHGSQFIESIRNFSTISITIYSGENWNFKFSFVSHLNLFSTLTFSCSLPIAAISDMNLI